MISAEEVKLVTDRLFLPLVHLGDAALEPLTSYPTIPSPSSLFCLFLYLKVDKYKKNLGNK